MQMLPKRDLFTRRKRKCNRIIAGSGFRGLEAGYRENTRLRNYASSMPNWKSTSYLDLLLVTPRFVLSLRRLISTATVSIRVRRSSDNAEQDIGFVNNALDSASLLAFVASSNGYVTTIYDQTGNGEHALQTTNANQPLIVNGGVYSGYISFTGSPVFMKITSLTMGTSYFDLYMKAALPGSVGMIFQTSTIFSSPQTFNFETINSTQVRVYPNNGSGSTYRMHYMTINKAMAQITVMTDRTLSLAAGIDTYQSGVLLAETLSGANNTISGLYTTYDAYIGATNGATNFQVMSVDTIVGYTAKSLSDRTNIEYLVS